MLGDEKVHAFREGRLTKATALPHCPCPLAHDRLGGSGRPSSVIAGRCHGARRRGRAAERARPVLRDVLHMVGEHFIDERQISQIAALRFLLKLVNDAWIETNRNQLARLVAERRTSDAAHCAELRARRFRNVREINRPGSRTPRVLSGSPDAR